MSNLDKLENKEEIRIMDKEQIEAEEKENMLKTENENITDTQAANPEGGGPVKAALSGDVTEEGLEVKPKFIPIGAIKMPGFFTRNNEKSKDEDEIIEKSNENDKTDDSTKPKHHRLRFLHTCPLTGFLRSRHDDSDLPKDNTKGVRYFNFNYSKIFKKDAKDPEATLASMETLDDKLETTNDGMENVKLEIDEPEGKVATRLPLKERIRKKQFIIDDIVVCGIVLLVLLAVIVGVVIVARAGPPTMRPLRLGRYMTTITTCGPVEGILDDGVYKFYSIPYASPPIKEKRFTYAQPLNNISMCWNGTLEVHSPGPLCLQFLENRSIIGEEDCLTLDVTTPHVRYNAPLPVVVLIGANSLAGGISPAQPSALYARTKEVVFVRPNFRLGPFGFLALDIISKSNYPPTSGNYGLSDLLVALKWIKDNIIHFGGDPNSVTLLGHRAGATLTAALTTVHKAHKLYSRVWCSSPSVIFPGLQLEQSQRDNEEFKSMTKCDNVECLRRMSSTEVLSSTPYSWLGNNVSLLPVTNEFQRSWLVLDGQLLRVHAYESWNAQKEAIETGKEKIFRPMVFGTTQHSAHSDVMMMNQGNITAKTVEEIVENSVIGEKNLTNEVFKHFNKTYAGLTEMISSIRVLCPLVSLARFRLGAPMYLVMGSGAGGGISKSGIAGINSDVEAILGTFDSEVPEQRRYMAAMQQLFYYFVWHGRLPGPESDFIAVGQDLLKLPALPACDLLIREDIVPRYAHID